MIEDLHPDFGPEIELDEAMEILESWSVAGAEHGFLFNGKNECAIRVLSKIVKTHENLVICKDDTSSLFFRFEGARFVFGPMALMEFPTKQGSVVEGLHVFLKTGSYLFISSQAQLPDTDTLSLSAP